MHTFELLAGGAEGPQSFMVWFEATAPSEPVARQMVIEYGAMNKMGELVILQVKNTGSAQGRRPRVNPLTGRGFRDFH